MMHEYCHGKGLSWCEKIHIKRVNFYLQVESIRCILIKSCQSHLSDMFYRSHKTGSIDDDKLDPIWLIEDISNADDTHVP